MQQSRAHTADENRSGQTPVYLYVVGNRASEDGETLFLTSFANQVNCIGIPERYNASSPQAFQPVQISHEGIKRETNFDKSSFTVHALVRNVSSLARYALTSTIPRLLVEVWKVNPGRSLAGLNLSFDADVSVVNSGYVSGLAFNGLAVAVEVSPEPLFVGAKVPRCRWGRTCNHQLYGPGCGKSRAAFGLTGDIVSVNRTSRTIVIEGQHDDDIGGFFSQGVALHGPTGERLPIFSSALVDGNTQARLVSWSPEIETGQSVTFYAGCNHTLDQCVSRFNNAANFGGFPDIPNKNITFHGV